MNQIETFFRRMGQREMVLTILSAFVLFALVWYFFFRKPQPVMVMMQPEVNVQPRNNELVGGDVADKRLVLFYAPWCGHCKAMAPAWEELTRRHDGKDIEIVKVNADENPEQTREMQIEGYPTVVLFKDGKAVRYNGDRSLEDLEAFINN